MWTGAGARRTGTLVSLKAAKQANLSPLHGMRLQLVKSTGMFQA